LAIEVVNDHKRLFEVDLKASPMVRCKRLMPGEIADCDLSAPPFPKFRAFYLLEDPREVRVAIITMRVDHGSSWFRTRLAIKARTNAL